MHYNDSEYTNDDLHDIYSTNDESPQVGLGHKKWAFIKNKKPV